MTHADRTQRIVIVSSSTNANCLGELPWRVQRREAQSHWQGHDYLGVRRPQDIHADGTSSAMGLQEKEGRQEEV